MSDEAITKPMLETILAEIREGFASIGERLTLIETRLTSVETRLTSVESRLTSVETRLTSIEKRVDIVETQLVHMDARNDRFESIVLALRAAFKEFRLQFNEPS